MTRRATFTTATEAPTTRDPIEPLPDFTQGEQSDGGEEGTYRQTDVETKPKKERRREKKKKKGRKKVAKKRAFDPSAIIKGRGGIPVKKNTTFRSLIRGVWWGRKPLLELLRTSVKLMDGQFLNKRTTLLSLMRNIPMAKKPLVDVIVNKML